MKKRTEKMNHPISMSTIWITGVVGALLAAPMAWSFETQKPHQQLQADLQDWIRALHTGGNTKAFLESKAPTRLDAWRRAAEEGSAIAQLLYGGCSLMGVGLKSDAADAEKWYRKAADQGLAAAQYELSELGFRFGLDQAARLRLLRKAADQGYDLAQNSLGACYEHGDWGLAKDEAEAANWYRKAANQNLEPAQFHLGSCYERGVGVAKNEGEAVKWYLKAANQNYGPAQIRLGVCYYLGKGARKDQGEGVNWFRKAAEQEYAGGQYMLGYCYEHGEGVAKDPAEALRWYRKAAAQGHLEAIKAQQRLER